MIKLLSIGNSFSQDAQGHLHVIASDLGIETKCVNLYVGGCELERHYKFYVNNEAAYDEEVNAGKIGKISLADALKKDSWDIITFQQVSGLSGMYETYEPYLSELIKVVKAACPNAKLYFHQTWAYDEKSTNGGFANYNNDQATMYKAIIDTTEKVRKNHENDFDGYIYGGELVQKIRETVSQFDIAHGGSSITRDTFHLSYNYGRYALGLLWCKTLLCGDVSKSTYVPEGMDEKTIAALRNCVAQFNK